MTITEEAPVEVTAENEGQHGRSKDRDFTKFRDYHVELATFINEHSGIDPVTPNQVKAVLTLRTDWSNRPETIAAREARKAEREAEKQKYAGMSDEQIKALKASKRAQDQAERLTAKAQEAMEKARALANAASGSGEDLAAMVEAQQGEEKPRRGLGRRSS